MMIGRLVVLLGLFLSLTASLSWSQSNSIASTEKRLKALKAQIAQYEKQLKNRSARVQSALQRLRRLERQIKLQEALIGTYAQQIEQMRAQERTLEQQLTHLQKEVTSLKQQYRDRALHAYKYGRMHDIALILAAESINQMFIRARYLHRFAQQRRRKMQQIALAQDSLVIKRKELEAAREKTESLLAESQVEQQKLQRLRRRLAQTVAQLRRENKTLQKELEQARKETEALEARLRELISAEMARQRERVRVNPRLAASMKALTRQFTQSKGKLPWPVEGVITLKFGEHVNQKHATRTPHPGVIISTRPAADVEAVFDGVVERVDFAIGYGTCVMIRHGEFFTVYCNLSHVNVQPKQYVQQGQVIGRAGTENAPRGSALFFALFKTYPFTQKKPESLNPEYWLRKP